MRNTHRTKKMGENQTLTPRTDSMEMAIEMYKPEDALFLSLSHSRSLEIDLNEARSLLKQALISGGRTND